MLLTTLLKMVVKSSRFFLVGLVLVIGVLFNLNLASAWIDCYEYGPFSTGGTPTLCDAQLGCVVTSDNVARGIC